MGKIKLASGKDIKKLLWKYSYGEWNSGNLGDFAYEFDEYPDFLAQVLLDHFLIQHREVTTHSSAKRPKKPHPTSI